jgi:POT family proton-dependent oligopeptide transporter
MGQLMVAPQATLRTRDPHSKHRLIGKLFPNQPPGLVVPFAVELWERFSYYGMRALLVFYLTRHFLFTDADSYLIYGAYTAMVYMTPVIGGVLADRYLGARKAVVFGAVLLVLGHFGLTIEGPSAMAETGHAPVGGDVYLKIFFLSLALITTGVGFLKTNTATLVGALYGRSDPRRDAGFTIYYMGINIGGAAAPLLCGWLGATFGWRYGFGAAGLGMLMGLAGFLRGRDLLDGRGGPPAPDRLREGVVPGISRGAFVYAASCLVVLAIWLVLQRREIVGPILAACGIVTALFIIYYAFARCTRAERDRLLVCAVLLAFTIGFWAFYEQMGSSLNLFADRFVNRIVLGHEIPAATLQSLPSIYVILLAPLFSALWLRLGQRGREPSTPIKFTLAIASCGLAFLVLALGARLVPASGKVPLIFFALNFLFLVTGELCLAPVAMAMVTRLAPERIVGLMMGAFLLAYSASSFISGLIAQLTSAQTIGGALVDPSRALATYTAVYTRLGLIALSVAVLLLVLAPVLRRYAREREGDAAAAVEVAIA